MSYTAYLRSFAEHFQRHFDEIAAHHNFELGSEFEIAVCKAMRKVLPNRFGICRGFIVNDSNARAGDDIIIFDRDRFPTLRMLPQDDFAQQNDIPVEAVCAYLEAKHTLFIAPTEAQRRNSAHPNIQKALSQVGAAKSVERAAVPLGFGGTFTEPHKYKGMTLFRRNGFMPGQLNPMFGAVISRRIQISEGDETEPTPAQVVAAYDEFGAGLSAKIRPDLIIAGPNLLGFPILPPTSVQPATFVTPFFVENMSRICFNRMPQLAWGVGIVLLLEALSLIELGRIQWGPVAINAANQAGGETVISKLH